PHLREKAGLYLKEGDFICQIDNTQSLEAEITLSEQAAARLQTGQRCRLKVRAIPFDLLWGTVEQIAPAAIVAGSDASTGSSAGAAPAATAPANAAIAGTIPSTIVVRARLDAGRSELRPGMSGYARIGTGCRPLGRIALDRLLRYVRTEFWW